MSHAVVDIAADGFTLFKTGIFVRQIIFNYKLLLSFFSYISLTAVTLTAFASCLFAARYLFVYVSSKEIRHESMIRSSALHSNMGKEMVF